MTARRFSCAWAPVLFLASALTVAPPPLAHAQLGGGADSARVENTAAPMDDRAGDGLLDRPELQTIVDAQIARDGGTLIARLSDPDPTLRARAAFALGSVQDAAAVPALLDLLEDRDPSVRADAAFALGQTADSSAASNLLAAFERAARGSQDSATTVFRHRLLEALGKTGDRASLVRLASLDPPPVDRAALALSIARYGIRGVADPAATALLARWVGGAPADPAGTDAWATQRSAAYFFARARDTTAWAGSAEAVRGALDGSPGSDPIVAMHLVAALAKLADPRDDRSLVEALASGADWRVRVNAARSLAGRTDRSEPRRALLAALDDPSTHVAVEAANALSAADSLPLDAQKAIAHRFLRWPDPWQVSAALAPALVRGDADGVVILRYTGIAGGGAAENPAEGARLLTALGLHRGRPSFLLLESAASAEDPRIAAAAVAALGERWRRGAIGGEATVEGYYRVFEAALRRRDLATASAAAPVLADPAFRPLGSVALLSEVYRRMEAPEEIEPMIEVLKALGTSGDPAARPVLEEALSAPHAVVRRAAADALVDLTGGEIEGSESDPGRAVRQETAVADPRDARRVDWELLRELGPRPRLVLQTDRGRIVVELAADQAPLTVQTILGFARDGRYDGVPFHRVVANFVIQGGDFERGDGYGGPGFAIPSEFTRIPFARGVIGMASAGKDTEGSQFFITHSDQPHLDGRYTAFGQVIVGMDMADLIVEGDRVLEATVQPTGSG